MPIQICRCLLIDKKSNGNTTFQFGDLKTRVKDSLVTNYYHWLGAFCHITIGTKKNKTGVCLWILQSKQISGSKKGIHMQWFFEFEWSCFPEKKKKRRPLVLHLPGFNRCNKKLWTSCDWGIVGAFSTAFTLCVPILKWSGAIFSVSYTSGRVSWLHLLPGKTDWA